MLDFGLDDLSDPSSYRAFGAGEESIMDAPLLVITVQLCHSVTW